MFNGTGTFVYGDVSSVTDDQDLIWHSVDGLVSMRGEPEERTCRKYMYYTTLLFCFAEYGLWTSSCFWMGDTLANVYFWFDMLLSVTFLLFVFALRKVGIR